MEQNSINRVELRGRIGQEPRFTTAGDAQIARFSVATSETFKDKTGTIREETTWHNVSAWAGRNISDFRDLKKGALVHIIGKIRNRKYTTNDGVEKYFSEISAKELSVVNQDQQSFSLLKQPQSTPILDGFAF